MEKQVQVLLNADNENGFLKALSAIASDLGFAYCAFGMKLPLPVSKPKQLLLSNYILERQQVCTHEKYSATYYAMPHEIFTVLPLAWPDKEFSMYRHFWDEAQAHGVCVSIALSCADSTGVKSLLALAHSNDGQAEHEVLQASSEISWLAGLAHQGLSRLLVPRLMPEAKINLTPRETDVLRWTADGKTSGEVGEIMSISERTVNFHVNNALIKLNAINKTAGAVKAAMLGFL